MNIQAKRLSILLMGSLLVAGGAWPADAQEKKVRARIGIQVRSGDRVMRAKSRDRLMAGDLLRIYVHPEKSSHVYVVHTDHKTATLLNMVQQKVQSSTLVMPSVQEFYQVDGASPVETFTIICSPKELNDVMDMLSSGEAPLTLWSELEKGLIETGRIELSQRSERPFAIAGNVRGIGESAGPDPFMGRLQIFSGKSILVKKYEFRVKK